MLIYKITNQINGKIYVGQTTQTLEGRIHNYKEEAKYRASRPISRAMNKFGFENFTFEILEDDIKTKEELDSKEIQYIQDLNCLDPEIGYNLDRGGNSAGKHSEETKKKMSLAQLGPKSHSYGKNGRENPTSKPVIDLKNLKIYESANLAANELGLEFSHVCSVVRGERGSSGEHIFRYLSGDPNVARYIEWPKESAKVKKFKTRYENILPIFDEHFEENKGTRHWYPS